MFVTWDGLSATNNYLSPHSSHLQLSHPSSTDLLLLAEHDENPYQPLTTGWNQADGRSLLGAPRIKGGNWQKKVWQCNFLAIATQIDKFDAFLSAQQNTNQPIALVDRWINGVITNRSIWLQVDRQYKTLVEGNEWWRLQFEAWEV